MSREQLIQRLVRLREQQYGDNANPNNWQELEDQCLAIIDYLNIENSDMIKVSA